MMRLLYYITALLILNSCASEENKELGSSINLQEQESGLFRLLSADESGIDFYNNVTETSEYNYFNFQYTYNGGGVAAGDINNDGLVDLYFSGNQVQDRLYLNLGGLRFKDITGTAGIADSGAFNFGVCMADVNQDGYQDIYVCRSGHKGLADLKANLLYINNGDSTFTESAKAYGLADAGYSIMSAFFDYDQDGDLDMYLSNHPVDYGQNLSQRLEKMQNPDYEVSDRLYRNNGDNTFTDVSKEAGISNYGHGLGLVIWDINEDGLDDIYVGNDYQSPDFVYINNGNGTFTDRMTEYFQHIPYYSMGVDVGDINNDGRLDINVVEMLPKDYGRRIKNVTDLDEEKYYVFESVGFYHQYMRNVLSKNNGNGSFTDVAPIAGVEATDWSWSTLIEDFDNDGWQDIYVTNGYLRDMQDKDYMKRAQILSKKRKALRLNQIDSITTSVKLKNYMYRNHGDYQFTNSSDLWGFSQPTFSYGAAAADLDNDGDLDLIVSNTNLNLSPDPAFVYENTNEDNQDFIQFTFDGASGNHDGEGAIIELTGSFGKQKKEMRRTRGYQSSLPRVLHFGTGEKSTVDVTVTWPDGQVEVKKAVSSGTRYTLKHSDASKPPSIKESKTLLKEVQVPGLAFTHADQLMNEYDKEMQLPLRLGMQGPGACTGDVNGDGREDLFICGAAGQASVLFLNQGDRVIKQNGPWESVAAKEGISASFADVDSDGDLDLYVCNGSVEFERDPGMKADDLFINDGKGNFSLSAGRIPINYSYTSVVKFADYDGDGDQDIFLGGRCIPFKYGESPFSFLYVNEGGSYSSQAANLAPDLIKAGMITDAEWLDVDGDGDLDLALAGDWMSIKVFINTGGYLKEETAQWCKGLKGSWNCLSVMDVNGDGQLDLIAGNDGLNSTQTASNDEPLRLYRGDLDGNGLIDLMIANKTSGRYFPERSFNYLRSQFPHLKKQYSWYADYVSQDVNQIFGPAASTAEILEIEELSSMVLFNLSDHFEAQELPRESQLSHINDILITDLNKNGKSDALYGGNEMFMPIEHGNADGHLGGVLLDFDSIQSGSAIATGLKVPGVTRQILQMSFNETEHFVFIRNDQSIKVYTLK